MERKCNRRCDRSPDLLVDRALAILAERFREALPLAEIAAALGVSSFHLAHVFQRRTGTTVHAWKTRLRLEAAIAALTAPPGAANLTELALELGFSSHSHFTAAFRSAFGVPPSDLRRRFQRLRDGDAATTTTGAPFRRTAPPTRRALPRLPARACPSRGRG